MVPHTVMFQSTGWIKTFDILNEVLLVSSRKKSTCALILPSLVNIEVSPFTFTYTPWHCLAGMTGGQMNTSCEMGKMHIVYCSCSCFLHNHWPSWLRLMEAGVQQHLQQGVGIIFQPKAYILLWGTFWDPHTYEEWGSSKSGEAMDVTLTFD